MFLNDFGDPARNPLPAFRSALRRAGLPTSTRLHDLRHSGASWWEKRISPAKLQALLGHTTPTMTSRYTHVQDDELVESMLSVFDVDGHPDGHPDADSAHIGG